ncbi:MAG TPA: TOMM precursor leader peptide-binding protein [Allosphingosinicella sp.]|nr:TOMM precursor leader peptide-binding protein [Allosphingosinicella sp.]
METRFSLNESVEISSAGEGRIYVRTPVEEFVILDRVGIIGKIIDAIRNGSPLETAIVGFEDPAVRDEVLAGAVALLKTRRIIAAETANTLDSTDPILNWLSHVSLTPNGAAPAIRLWGSGLLHTALASLLEEAGVACTSDEAAPVDGDHLIVNCLDIPDDARLREVNRRAVEADAAFLPVVLDRHVVSIGPLILPRATACYECVYHRVRAGRRSLEAFEAATERDHRPSGLAARFAAASAAAVIVRFLTGSAFDLHTAHVTRHNLLTGVSGHTVALKVPRCPVCGQANMRKPLRPAYSYPVAAVAAVAA